MTKSEHHENWTTKSLLRALGSAVGLAIILTSGLFAAQPAQAQTYTVLHKFRGGTDGSVPVAGLIGGASGSLYGTTVFGGGTLTCFNGCGTVFKVSATGKERVLYSFTGGTGGSTPYAGLVGDAAGNLYGTTYMGGDPTCNPPSGCGTVFKVNTGGKERVLYSFTAGADGSFPLFGGLVRDPVGNLYGTTELGGDPTCDCGTVFKLDKAGSETVLHRFTGLDGAYPVYASLVRDSAGNLYGTTELGGDLTCSPPNGCGTVFKVNTEGKEKVLYSFTAGADGSFPSAGLVRDAAGNLYGTTIEGGDVNCVVPNGCGTVFKLDKTGNETILHRFRGQADGWNPFAGLVLDPAGNLYGTTNMGGDRTCFPNGCGTVFKMDTTGTETVLHTFTGGADGSSPYAGLVRDSAGNLYGTTESGGDLGCNCGVVFKIIP